MTLPQKSCLGALVPLLMAACALPAWPQTRRPPIGPERPVRVLATFPLSDLFGVTWPDQPIEFRYDGGQPPADSRMMGPDGQEVAFQWVSSCTDATAVKGCILIRSGLPANSSYVWTLVSGRAPTAVPDNPVVMTQTGSYLQLSNGLTGVRIVTAAANPAPWNLAPVQGIQLADGSWTGVGAAPNLLYAEGARASGCIGCALRFPITTATGYSVSVTDSGPLKVVVKVSYKFQRPQYTYSQTLINTAGAGHYTASITLYANSKSVLLDEDSDMQFSWYLPLYAALQPDQARYRGADSIGQAGVSDPACGYEASLAVLGVGGADGVSPLVVTAPGASPAMANGQPVLVAGVSGVDGANGTFFAKTAGYPAGQFALYLDAALTNPATGAGAYSGGGSARPAYRGQGLNPTPDAYLDLTYAADRPAVYYCAPSGKSPGYRKLATAYPSAAHAAGWYDVLYNSAAGPSAPAVGFYVGRGSQQISSATGPSQAGIYTSNAHWISGVQDAGIQVDNLLRGPDASVATLVHRNWGIWVSTKADLLPTAAHQPIGDDQNSLTGINLSRLYSYQVVYPDPPGGWTWQYLPAASAAALISEVRDGTAVCGSVSCYYKLLYNSESSASGRALLDMWRGNSKAAVQAALNGALLVAHGLEQALVNGDNRFDVGFGYYRLGLRSSPQTGVLNAVLMDANSTADQRNSAKAALALFGCIFWDDDWFPIDNRSGDSAGLANQIEQYLQYRTQFAAATPSQPYLATVLTAAVANPVADFANYISATGAPAGSTHYQSAFFEPLILNYLRLSQVGTLSMDDPKWAAYANWELSIQTPPEPRFGNVRKGYSNGDGNTEADVRTAMLANALNPVNPSLAGNLMWAWWQSNSATVLTEDSQFVTTLAAIDPTIPPVTPALASMNFPGYHSVERHGFGTPNETVTWFINGGFYSPGGHRHSDDGQVSIYAHSAPLAIDWNANLYSPETPGRFVHDSFVWDTELTHAWNADNASLADANTLLLNPTNTEFSSFSDSTGSTATFNTKDGTVWTRTVRTLAYDASYPVIYVADSFTGPSSSAGKTLTWNLMATGAVQTPDGPVTPLTRFSGGCQSPAGQLPSAGTAYQLPAGLSQFSFTGAAWQQHATQGIDWDLFIQAPDPNAQFALGNWGHGCQSTREAVEYRTANGTAFAESQHILRIHDSGPLTTLILPYRKTEAPARSVTQQACGVQIAQGTGTTCINDSAAVWSDGVNSALTAFDASSQSAFGVTASGGPQEIILTPGKITWTMSGAGSGPRMLALAGSWVPDSPVTQANGAFVWSFAGGPQAAPVTITFSPGQ